MTVHSKILEALQDRSIIDLAPGLRKLVLETAELRLFTQGERLCQQGQPVLRLLIPVSDNVQLVDESSTPPRPFGYLQKNRSLCLREILDALPAPYSAIAEDDVTALSIPGRPFVEFLEKHPALMHYLRLMTSSAACRSLKTFCEGREMPQEAITELLHAASRDQELVAAGATIDLGPKSLILIDSGRVRISSTGAETKRFDAELGEGAWFGGEALVLPNRYSYAAVAMEPTRIRRAALADIGPILADFGLTETMFDEPWILKSKFSVESLNSEPTQEITILPGETLSPQDLLRAGISCDATRLRSAARDDGSAIASLANIAYLMNVEINLSSIEVDLTIARRVTPLVIAECMERFGLAVTPLFHSFEALPRQALPGLVFYGPRLVLLLRATAKAVVLVDPCQGFLAVEREAFLAHWRGGFLEISKVPTDAILDEGDDDTRGTTKEDVHARIGRRLIQAMVRAMMDLKTLSFNRVGIMLLGLAVGTISPKFNQFVIDEVLTLHAMDTAWLMLVGSVLLLLFTAATNFLGELNWAHFGLRFNQRFSTLFYRHAISQRSGSTKNKVAEATANFGELRNVTGFVSEAAFSIGSSLVSVVLYTGILLTYDWKLASTALTVFPCIFLLRLVVRGRLKRMHRLTFESGRAMNGLVSEQINAISTIKAAAAESGVRALWEAELVKNASVRRQLSMEASAVEGVVGIVTSAVQVGCLYFGLRLASTNAVTIGEVFAVNMYVASLTGPVHVLASFFDQIEHVKVSMRRLTELFSTLREETPKQAVSAHSLILRGKIRLERVAFRYDDDSSWIIRDMNLTIYPRQILAIVGRSGCGKTTLANLVAGSLAPTSGRIFFDDFDGTLLSPSCVRKQFGVVMQDNELFAGTLLENLAYADDVPDEDMAKRAATMSGAAEFAERMPGAYDYFLAEGGLGLSGGQRQRLSIGRTLYRDPSIIIMDEATSALDAESEGAFISRLRDIMQGRTAIIIAHRLSTIRHADRIVVMKEGEIVEDGTHAELLTLQGHYRELFQDQVSSAEG